MTGFSDNVVVTNAITTNATVTSSGTGIWTSWNSGSVASTTDPRIIWNNWTASNTTTNDGTSYLGNNRTPTRVLTKEQVHALTEEQERQRLQHIREEAERRVAREEAEQKAEALLLMHLDRKQRKSYQKDHFFEVLSQSGKHYRVNFFRNRNVLEMDDAKRKVASYCIVPRENIPLADQLLIQKLMLQYQENDFLRIANRSTD